MVHDAFTELLLSVEGQSKKIKVVKSEKIPFDVSFGWKARIESRKMLDWLESVRDGLVLEVPRKDLPKIPRRKGKRDSFTQAWIESEDNGTEFPEPPEPNTSWPSTGKKGRRTKGAKPTNWQDIRQWKTFVTGSGMARYNQLHSKKLPSTSTTPIRTVKGKMVSAKEFKAQGGKADDTDLISTPLGDISIEMPKGTEETRADPWTIYEPASLQTNPLVLRPKLEYDDSPHCRWDLVGTVLGPKYEAMRSKKLNYREMVDPSPFSYDFSSEFEEWYCRISNLKIPKYWKDDKGIDIPIRGLVDPNIDTRDAKSTRPKFKIVQGIRIPKGRASTIFGTLLHGNPLNFAGKPGTGKTQLARRISAVRGGCMVFIPPLGEEAEGDLLGQWNTAKQIVAIEQAKIAAERLRLTEEEMRSTTSAQRKESLETQKDLLEKQIILGADPYNEVNWEVGGIEKALRGRTNPVTGKNEGCMCVIDEVNRYGYTTQNRLLHVTDQKEIVRPITHERIGAEGGFGIIVTTNEDDLGVKEMSGALQRRFQTIIFSTPSIEEEIEIIGLAVDGTREPKCPPTAKTLVNASVELRRKYGSKGPTTAEVMRAYRVLTGKAKLEELSKTKLFQWEKDGTAEMCFKLYDTPQTKETIASFLTKESEQLNVAIEIVGKYLSSYAEEPTEPIAKSSTISPRGM